MKNILTLNAISPVINDIFDTSYNVAPDAENPVGIILRSFKMHDYPLSPSTIAVARAGAGVNNIPVEDYAARGVVGEIGWVRIPCLPGFVNALPSRRCR